MVKRQFPNPVELFELMKFKKPDFNGKRRRLQSALTIHDLRTIAKRRTPPAAFDYTDGSAEGELSRRLAKLSSTRAACGARVVLLCLLDRASVLLAASSDLSQHAP